MTTPTHPRLALFAICLGFAMITLDATIVTVALPAIQRSLGGSLTGLQWVVDAYTVALAAVLLSAGTAADRFGARAVYLTGLSGFVLASVACVLAPELPVLVAARAAQGLGAAGLIPPSLTLIVHMFPDPARRTWALGIWGGTSGIGLSAGPVLGGLAVSGIGWQAVFLAAGAVAAGLMTAAGGGGATASVGAALDSATSAGAEAETTSGEDAARKGDDTEAWQRMAMKELKKAIKQRLRCGLQSTKQVQQFFLRTPCKSLDELLFALEDSQGNVIVVSVAWAKMSSGDDATQLKTLEDTYGTGDITPIATQVLELGGIHFTGAHYASRQDDSLVVVSEAEPVRGHPSTALLNDAPKVAAVLPPP